MRTTHESMYENADLGSAIILKFSWEAYTAKITFVSTLSPSWGGIFIAFGIPRLTFKNQNLLQLRRTSSNKILGGTSATICLKQLNNEMWNAWRNMHENFLYFHLAGDDCITRWERWSLERACNVEKNSHVFPSPLLWMHFEFGRPIMLNDFP